MRNNVAIGVRRERGEERGEKGEKGEKGERRRGRARLTNLQQKHYATAAHVIKVFNI
jgi:hypothetical protein